MPHYSSRITPETLGMYLFIASEIMLFGSFFTAYFFVRIVNGVPWPTPPYHLPVFVAVVNTLHPHDVERDDALGDRRRSSAATSGGCAPACCSPS